MVLNKINDIFILSKFSKRRSIVEKENTGSRIKRRIIVIVFSMLLCMLLIGVSVYAALSQTLTSPGTITITTAGQAKVGITVDWATGSAEEDTLFASIGDQMTTIKGLSYANQVTKKSDENTKSGTGPSIKFGVGSYTYGVYKITFTNTDSAAVNYTIAFKDQAAANDYEFDSQITLYTGTETVTEGKTALTGSLNKSETTTVYVVIAINVEPENLTAQALDHFNLVIGVTSA